MAEDSAGTVTLNNTINNVLNKVSSAGMPYALYWEVYSNELAGSATPPVNGNNAAVKGFYLVKPDGTPATAWHQYRQRIITADPSRATTSPIIAASHLVYQSDFPVSTSPSTALGPDWTSSSSGCSQVSRTCRQLDGNSSARTPGGSRRR